MTISKQPKLSKQVNYADIFVQSTSQPEQLVVEKITAGYGNVLYRVIMNDCHIAVGDVVECAASFIT
jgi:hypothetical protein